MIAVIFASGRLERVYTGLSLLVSAAAEGLPARGLVTFAALAPLLDDALEARALRPAETPSLSRAGRAAFARTLVELRATAAELPGCELWACAAGAELTGVSRALIDERLDGILSMPRFVHALGGSTPVVV
jgi:peroxiredoxin family protein